MTWGEWMCPIKDTHHELELERMRRSIDSYGEDDLRVVCWQLAQLSHQQDLVIRGATRRIAELEAREALQG